MQQLLRAIRRDFGRPIGFISVLCFIMRFLRVYFPYGIINDRHDRHIHFWQKKKKEKKSNFYDYGLPC